MTDRVQIFDTTLRGGEQSPGASLNVGGKVETARLRVHPGQEPTGLYLGGYVGTRRMTPRNPQRIWQ